MTCCNTTNTRRQIHTDRALVIERATRAKEYRKLAVEAIDVISDEGMFFTADELREALKRLDTEPAPATEPPPPTSLVDHLAAMDFMTLDPS